MANPRALDKRRKSIRNIRKITRTMELIATARFRKAMDRANAATDYTRRITQIVQRLAASGLDAQHPLLVERPETKAARLLVLTSNRGLCGGYNGAVVRAASQRYHELKESLPTLKLDVSGKRGVGMLKFRKIEMDQAFTQFDDQPKFDEVAVIADQMLSEYASGKIDRVDVAYTRFISAAKQVPTVETLLPLAGLGLSDASKTEAKPEENRAIYEFLPSAASIMEEIVPMSFKVRLFKCFLDAAVSEQIARMVAMKSATENAGDMIKQLSMTYNRARQARITGEIMEVIGGAQALEG
jgi:F-type H+-transporting ATPase subunit gamma